MLWCVHLCSLGLTDAIPLSTLVSLCTHVRSGHLTQQTVLLAHYASEVRFSLPDMFASWPARSRYVVC